MTVEQVILIILQATLFISALNLGFGATRFELSFLFRRPGLFARTFLAMYVVVPVVTAVILILVPLPVGVKTAVILLSISPVAITLPFKHAGYGGKPGICLFPVNGYVADKRGHRSYFLGHSDGFASGS